MELSGFFLFFTLLLLSVAKDVHCRSLSSNPEEPVLVSDGSDFGYLNRSTILRLPQENLQDDVECRHVYGFLPCAINIKGYTFQVIVFECLLIGGDYLLFHGSTKLFGIFGVGIFGGFFMQLLLMFPRITLMLSNGLHSSQDIAQSMVLGSIGFAVGYTVFSLTLQWGSCVVFGCMDVSNNDSDDTNKTLKTERSIPKHLSATATKIKSINTRASVKPDADNRRAAWIMLMSFIPYIMVQLSVISDSPTWTRVVVLITLIVSVAALVSYFVYQFFDRSEQHRRLEYAVSGIWNHMQSFLPQTVSNDGKHKQEDLEALFKEYDVDNDGKIHVDEIKNAIFVGNLQCNIDEAAKELIKQCDRDNDGMLDKKEFFDGITTLLQNFHYLQMEQGENQNRTFIEKLLLMETVEGAVQVIVGALIVIFLARPFMMNIELLSSSVGIPSFFITFVVIPLARNLKQALSARVCNPKRRQRMASLKFSQIYGDVTMNNLMSMMMMLAIVCSRGLTWDYSAEVFILLVIGAMIGVPAVFCTNYPFWISIFAFSLYPFSLFLIYLRFYVLNSN